jgi:precorrin-2 dehydrogenase/sirohydrochlorin ferrochelatase
MQIPRTKHKLYPAFMVLEGRRCVVVGGGHVAARKVRSLLAAGAQVFVISLSLHSDLQTALANNLLEHTPASYTAEYLTGASLVFAATNDPEVNLQIARDAHERGLWVNVADNHDECDFYVPATIYRQDLALAISTGGESPAFARYVRELLERSLSNTLGQALTMVAQARPLLLAQPQDKQAQLWEDLLALRLETVIETQGYATAYHLFNTWLEQILTAPARKA